MRIDLTAGWILERLVPGAPLATSTDPLPIPALPMQVHDVLRHHGRITDPRTPTGPSEVLWVAESDWVYRCRLPTIPTHRRLRLHAAGLDAPTEIWLDDRLLATHADSFVPLELDLTGCTGGTLTLRAMSPKAWMARQPAIPGVQPVRALRKPLEDFNTFNGAKPYFTTLGVYAPIHLEAASDATLDHWRIDSRLSDDHRQATITVQAGGTAWIPDVPLVLTVRDPAGAVVATATAQAHGATWSHTLAVTIAEPQLWWPNGYGAQPLYTVGLDAGPAGMLTRRVGLRRLTCDGDFRCTVNGTPVKLWGANLTALPVASKVWDDAMAGRLVHWAQHAGFTMLRAWGPAQPWDERLFDLCDAAGILVWAEFAHTGGSHIPQTAWFDDLCRAEAEHWVRAWRHHPSIALWCGGNENMLFPDENVGNTNLFTAIYRDVVARLDPERHYHANSPWGDRDGYHNGTAAGDSHVRDYLWWIPGNQWPNFLSETIRLTVPLRKTLERHLGNDFWPAEGFDGRRRAWNEVPLPPAWSRMAISYTNPGGIASRLAPMWDLYEHDGTADGLLYRLGAASERYIRTTVERYRRGRPVDDASGIRRTQGHLWWKFNDTWPLIYSSLIDDLGEANMAYYAMARAYRPILLSIEVGDRVTAWVVNDTATRLRGTLHLRQLSDREGHPQAELSAPVDLAPGASAPVIDASSLGMLWLNNPFAAVLVDSDGRELAHTIDWLAPERERWYPDATLSLAWDGDAVLVTTSHVTRCIELAGDADGDAFGWDFSDNFFDLYAGRTQRIALMGRHRRGRITARARNAKAVTLDIG